MNDNSITVPVPGTEANLPQWLAALKKDSLSGFLEALLPTRLDESWRFGELKKADVSKFRHAPLLSADEQASLLTRLPVNDGSRIRVVFVNGQLAEMPASLPAGLKIAALDSLEQPPCCNDRSVDFARLSSGRFALLNAASLTNGLVVSTEPGASIPASVEIVYIVSGELASIFPHTTVCLGENSSLQLIERHVGFEDTEQLCVAVQELRAGKGSKLDYALLQQLGPSAHAVELGSMSIEAGASITHFSAQQGGEWVRQELFTSMVGREARAELLSANYVDGGRVLDQRTWQEHASPGAYSNLLFKNVLNDSAKTVFSGMIKVDPGAHETDAYQSNRNLMLSDEAEVNSMPGLEILADNVRCSHGSATSAIEPEEVFYLRSRGIDRVNGEKMIAQGFLDQVLERIDSESFIAEIRNMM